MSTTTSTNVAPYESPTMIRFTTIDPATGAVEDVSDFTIGMWLDLNDPENEEVRDAAIALETGAATRVEMCDQASRYVVEVLGRAPAPGGERE